MITVHKAESVANGMDYKRGGMLFPAVSARNHGRSSAKTWRLARPYDLSRAADHGAVAIPEGGREVPHLGAQQPHGTSYAEFFPSGSF